MKTVLRWATVLPAAIAGYVFVQLVVICLSAFGTNELMAQFVNSVAGPAAFILGGAGAAPAHKFITAICLAVIHAMVLTAVVTIGFVSRVRTLDLQGLWLILTCLMSIGVTICLCHYLRQQEDREKQDREWFEREREQAVSETNRTN